MVKAIRDLTVEELDVLARSAWAHEADASRRQGLPVTCVEDGAVWRLWPDGRREHLGAESPDNTETRVRRARA